MNRLSIRSNIITGILVLAPFGAVLGIIVWIRNFLMGLTRMVPDALSPKVLLGVHDPLVTQLIDFGSMLLILAVITVLVWCVGIVSRNYFGHRLFEAFANAIARVPVLRTVYSTLEQLIQAFTSGGARNFRRVVLVEYPRKGLTTLAFVTGEREDNLLTIYVPTTPNPTSGFYLLVPQSEVKDANMSVEEALKEIISMGIVHKNG